MTSEPQTLPAEHYLKHGWDLKSWLLTTDHKRIGLLYLVSITLMFAIGSIYAGIVRWNLLVPDGSHMSAETYNKVFTGHGVVMVFFFLIPSIPATLGNFLDPADDRRARTWPSRGSTCSPGTSTWWAPGSRCGRCSRAASTPAGPSTRPTARVFAESNVELAAVGIFITGFSSILTGLNFIVTIHKMRAPGHDLVPAAAVRLGALRDVDHPGARDAGDRDHDPARRARAHLPLRLLRPEPGRRPDPVPAPVLVLLAPGRLHHDPARRWA